MSVKIGHASRPEGSGVNGVKGDQTGKEVCVRDWYNGPWDYMAIFPDEKVREKHAATVEAGCKNDNIGYSQFGADNRNTLNTLAKAVGYNLSKVGPCNCDCSSFQNVAAVASGSGATYGSNGWTTSTMKAALVKAGYKIVTDKKYLASADYCVRGAIYVRASAHTVCGLTNGSKYADTLAAAGIKGGKAPDPKPEQPKTEPTAPATKLITKLASAKSRDTKLRGAYKTTADLNLRYGPDSSKYASIGVMGKGATVQCYGYYTETNGTKWLYVVAKLGGQEKTGFCSSKYLKKA